eukprot:CAMPEP_0181082596 /NCGR_PEP_ID=MMETSP1071-20121207/3707_1 /TAXON_ID=35127 /ORGANISM="Thalassiosira sp., Strain NH16" /LENGTH=335 /DNA_ID=CAMNT_0023164195 /DNA_START=301 /DNA_END=1305 /DNA_ORIENTATION=-
MREQMWYKNQIYLLNKQRDECTPPRPRRPATRVSSRYESNRNSPQGVNDLDDEFESTNMHRNMQHCDSRKEGQFRSAKKNHGRPIQDLSRNDDNDTRTNQSSSLFDLEETSTNQSSSLFDDETRTNQSSSMCHEEDTYAGTETNFDDVTLGSILDNATMEDVTVENESIMNSLMDGTPYTFELVDDSRQRRKYKLGVGQNGTTSTTRKRAATPSIPNIKGSSSGGRRAASTAPQGRPGKNTNDDSVLSYDDDEAHCPFLPRMLDEVSGTIMDIKSALNQVLYAFFISEDDIDKTVDRIRCAKLELAEMSEDRKENETSVRCCAGSEPSGAPYIKE